MPVKSPPRERPLLEMFLSEYENGSWKTAVPDWIEERIDGAVEVIVGRDDGSTLAIEHTIVQPFVGEKADSNVFMQAFGRIERNQDLAVPGRNMTVIIPVAAIPKGYIWEEVGVDLLTWLKANHQLASIEGETQHTVSVGSNTKLGPLPLAIKLQTMYLPDDPGVTVISRGPMPKTLPEIVEEALRRKVPKLVRTIATKRVLLIERDQISLGDTQIMQEIGNLAANFPQLKDVHEIWIADTSILASDGWTYFRHFDGRGLVETMEFENAALKLRRDHSARLGPAKPIGA